MLAIRIRDEYGTFRDGMLYEKNLKDGTIADLGKQFNYKYLDNRVTMTQNVQGFVVGDGSVIIETKSELPFKTKDLVKLGSTEFTILDIELVHENQDLSNQRGIIRFIKRIKMT